LADRSLTDRPDFKLFAESPGECIGTQTAHPVIAAASELNRSIFEIVVGPHISRYCALDGMAEIILVIRIAIGPAMHGTQRLEVSADKTVAQSFTRALFCGQTERMHDSEVQKRSLHQLLPLHATFRQSRGL